jgi:cytochrome oxidase Cu insertion factor (SCO1/SenC/PrrC family)
MNDPVARGRNTLLLMLGIAAAPFLFAWLLFNFTGIGRGGAPASHGTLVVPPRPLPDAVLREPGPESAATAASYRLHRHWTLVHVAGASCDQHCETALLTMRQVRLALGSNAARVQRVLAVDDGALDLLTPRQRTEFAGLLLVETSRLAREVFHLPDGADPRAAGRLYLVDPLGNLMMFYAPDADPAGIVKDLKRLLRYSRIG